MMMMMMMHNDEFNSLFVQGQKCRKDENALLTCLRAGQIPKCNGQTTTENALVKYFQSPTRQAIIHRRRLKENAAAVASMIKKDAALLMYGHSGGKNPLVRAKRTPTDTDSRLAYIINNN
ncbi:Signal recognition particleprotein [Trichinella pseudospiralis]